MTTSSNRPPIRTAELADPTMDRAEFLKSALDKAVAENAGLKQRIAALEAALVEAGDGRIDYLLREINAAFARIAALEAELEAANNRADVAWDMMRGAAILAALAQEEEER